MLLRFSYITTIIVNVLVAGCSVPNVDRSKVTPVPQKISSNDSSAKQIVELELEGEASEPINKSIFVSQDILRDTTLVSSFTSINKLILSKPKQEYKIAVLIPLSGHYQHVGEQIRDGILKLYFNYDLDMQVNFFDSSSGNINVSYRSIVNSSFNMVIGPLLSHKLKRIVFSTAVVNVPLNVPFNAFASLHNASINFKINNQIEQLTQRAIEQNLVKAIVLVDNTANGASLAEKISDIWFKSGRSVVKVAFIGQAVNTINQQFAGLFQTKQNIRIYETNNEGELLFIGNVKDDFPFVRQDIDVVFNLLSLEQSRYLIPALNLIGGVNPKIYSSSKITRSEAFSPIADRDLEGINYLDIPWRYSNTDLKLFEAVGIDALALAIQLWSADRFQYNGLTGKYLFNATGIKKELNWYRFDSKKITLIN